MVEIWLFESEESESFSVSILSWLSELSPLSSRVSGYSCFSFSRSMLFEFSFSLIFLLQDPVGRPGCVEVGF